MPKPKIPALRKKDESKIVRTLDFLNRLTQKLTDDLKPITDFDRELDRAYCEQCPLFEDSKCFKRPCKIADLRFHVMMFLADELVPDNEKEHA